MPSEKKNPPWWDEKKLRRVNYAPDYSGWVIDLGDGTCRYANEPLLGANGPKWGDRVKWANGMPDPNQIVERWEPERKLDLRRALTLYQPWASLILRGKDVENRPRPLSYRGELWIHAGQKWDEDAIPVLQRLGLWREDWPTDPDAYPRGVLIAKTTLADVVIASPSPWFRGPYGYVLKDVQPVTPEPVRGAQGLWIVGNQTKARRQA